MNSTELLIQIETAYANGMLYAWLTNYQMIKASVPDLYANLENWKLEIEKRQQQELGLTAVDFQKIALLIIKSLEKDS